MKTSHCHEQAQGLPFDFTSNHNRKVADLDYLLRDALWSSQDSAPDIGAYGRPAVLVVQLSYT